MVAYIIGLIVEQQNALHESFKTKKKRKWDEKTPMKSTNK